MALSIGNKNNLPMMNHLNENYAAVITGSAFPRHAVLKCEGMVDDMHYFIVNAANKDEHIEELTHDKIKCATILGMGDVFTSAPCPVVKYLVVFTDGRQAIFTSRLAESHFVIEQLLF